MGRWLITMLGIPTGQTENLQVQDITTLMGVLDNTKYNGTP